MRRIRTGFWAVMALVVVGVLWTYTVPLEWKDAAADRGRAALVGEPRAQEHYDSFGPIDLRKFMPKTQVGGANLGASFTFKQAIWVGMGDAGGYNMIWQFATPLVRFTITGMYDDPTHPGEYGINIRGDGTEANPFFRVEKRYWYTTPTSEDDVYWVEIDCSVATTEPALQSTSGSVIIGEKANATHSKEKTFTDSWTVAVGTPFTATIDDVTDSDVTTVEYTTALSIGVAGTNLDTRDWVQVGTGMEPGIKYVTSIENIQFGAVAIDTSSYTARTWVSSGPAADKVWVEGFGGNNIGLWASEWFDHAPYEYDNYTGGTISAPYSYDFTNCYVKWLSGADIDTVEVTCTGLRTIIGGNVFDIPWKGTLAALRALGTYVQKHGCYFWDTQMADMLATVELYLDYGSMKAHGMLDHGIPQYKVEGCMYRGESITIDGATITPPSPVDGDYWAQGTYNGLPSWTNGAFWIWAQDAEGSTYAIGPVVGSPPYYVTIDSGLVNIYQFDEATGFYADAVIDEASGYKRFTGLTGLGPVVSQQLAPEDPDTSVPSFAHDGTFIFQGWPLSATGRGANPRMTDVIRLEHVGETWEYVGGTWVITGFSGLGIYGPGPAVAHTAWVASAGVTVPDAAGNFTVTAPGATLTLTLPGNYIQRQADVGNIGAITLPTAYWIRQADYLYDPAGPPSDQTHEAIYDWRGWGYLQSAFILPEAVTETTIGVAIGYYMDLDGTGDSHVANPERVTSYTYDPGELYSYSADHAITVRDEPSREARILTDLYWVGRPVALVQTLTFTFNDAGDYQIQEPELWPDPGDQQTGRVAYVRPNATIAGHGGAHKFFESWMYAQGGFSGVYDGVYDRALYAPDNAKGNQIEKCFPQLNVLVEDPSGIDVTTNLSLAGLFISASSDAWNLVYSASAEAAHMVDADAVTLKTLNCYDLIPAPSSFDWAVAARCFRMVCVNGLPYNFSGTHYVGGLGHGMAKTGATTRKRGTFDANGYPETLIGGLYRHPLSSEVTSDYGLVDGDVRVDEHGHWHAPQDYTDPYDDGPDSAPSNSAQDLYGYAIKPTGGAYNSLGRFPTREYVAVDVIVVGKEIYIVEHSTNLIYQLEYDATNGIRHLYSSDAGQYYRDSKSLAPYALPKQDVLAENTDGSPAGYVDMRGVLRIYHIKDNDLKRLVSTDWGNNWSSEATVISGEDISKAMELNVEGRQYCLAINSSGEVYCYQSSTHFDDASWTLNTNKFLVATGADAATNPGGYHAHGKLWCFFFNGDGDRKAYRSENFGKTWALET